MCRGDAGFAAMGGGRFYDPDGAGTFPAAPGSHQEIAAKTAPVQKTTETELQKPHRGVFLTEDARSVTPFYINGVISGFSHGRELLRLLRFLRFAHGCNAIDLGVVRLAAYSIFRNFLYF